LKENYMQNNNGTGNKFILASFEKFNGESQASCGDSYDVNNGSLQSQEGGAIRSLKDRVLDSWRGVRLCSGAGQLVVPRPVAARRLHWVGSVALGALLFSAGSRQADAWWTDGSPAPLVQLNSGHRSNVFYEGEPISFGLSTAGASSYTVRDYYGQVVDSGPVNGSTLTINNVGQAGWYKVYLQGNTLQTDWGYSVGGTTFCIFRRDARFPDFSTTFKALTRVDPTVDFTWNGTSPGPGVPQHGYHVVWTGQIKPRYSQKYTFNTITDYGCKVWVNNVLLVDHSVPNRGMYSGQITLTAGQKYAVRMEYVENMYAGGEVHLVWSSQSQATQIVPQSVLFSTVSNATTGDGLTAAYYDDTHYISADGAQDTTLQSVLGSGPERFEADVSDATTTADSIRKLDHNITIAKDLYAGRDAARPRPLLIAFSRGTRSIDAVRQIVARYQNDVQYWEIRNEPNFASEGYNSNPSDFVTLEMRPFYNLVKSINPSLKVIGPGCVSIGTGGDNGLGWAQAFLQAGGAQCIDAFSFHAYNNVNGDAELARWSLGGLNAMLAANGLANIEKWQTEQGYPAAYYGVYVPRHQGRWTMLQKMMFEQYGIPKEHDHLWYDKSHGFWEVPAWMENDDSSLNPAAPLMRVWSEELFGTTFSKPLDFGNPGNKLMVGNLFVGASNQVAALMSTGATDTSVQLQTSSNTAVKIVSAFGVSSVVTPVNNQLTVAVGELPVYVESAAGQSLNVVPLNWGGDLALLSGTTAASSGEGPRPGDPNTINAVSKIINGKLENWRMTQQSVDQPWMSNQATISPSSPLTVEVRLPSVQTVDRVLIYACVPFSDNGSLLDYDLQYDNGGSWVSLGHVSEAPRTLAFATPLTRTRLDSFYSDRSVFAHAFQPVQTSKIRLVINDVTWGGGVNLDAINAGGENGPHQATLREVEIYNSAGTSSPTTPAPAPSSPAPAPSTGSTGTAPSSDTTPSNGTARTLPGIIQAEDYNLGGQTVAYLDATLGNSGGAYRSDDVDIESCSDAGGGYNVGWTNAGEWLKYDVNVQATALYNMTVRVSSPNDGKTMHIEVNGVNVTGSIAIPNTGSWQNWRDVTVPNVNLSAGAQTLKVVMDGGDFNLNYIRVTAAAAAAATSNGTPYGGTARSLPGIVEAEDYNLGGHDVAYSDATSGNSGGAYRSDDVDIESCSDAGGGYNVGWTNAGEWLKYDVNVQATALYNMTVRVSSPNDGKTMHIEVNGVNVTGSIAIPNTGSWQNWRDVTVPNVNLSAGAQTMKVVIDGDGFNLNYVSVTPTS